MDKKLKALSCSIRRDILMHLLKNPMYAGDIHRLFNVSAATVSHHISILKDSGLITMHRDGVRIIYRINNSGMKSIFDWLNKFV